MHSVSAWTWNGFHFLLIKHLALFSAKLILRSLVLNNRWVWIVRTRINDRRFLSILASRSAESKNWGSFHHYINVWIVASCTWNGSGIFLKIGVIKLGRHRLWWSFLSNQSWNSISTWSRSIFGTTCHIRTLFISETESRSSFTKIMVLVICSWAWFRFDFLTTTEIWPLAGTNFKARLIFVIQIGWVLQAVGSRPWNVLLSDLIN